MIAFFCINLRLLADIDKQNPRTEIYIEEVENLGLDN